MHLTAPSSSATVVVIDRNRWSPSVGTGGRHRRNAQSDQNTAASFVVPQVAAAAWIHPRQKARRLKVRLQTIVWRPIQPDSGAISQPTVSCRKKRKFHPI